MSTERNITRTRGDVSVTDRGRALGQVGSVVWLTGLSGSGKSTIAYELEAELRGRGRHAFVLDGDNLRHGLCSDLGFTAAARTENIRRVGHVAGLFASAGLLAICAFISPYEAGRKNARSASGTLPFFEVFLDVGVEVCESRDPKGLYAKARLGEIKDFTGVDAPYEKPSRPDLTLDTDKLSSADCVIEIVKLLCAGGVFDAEEPVA